MTTQDRRSARNHLSPVRRARWAVRRRRRAAQIQMQQRDRNGSVIATKTQSVTFLCTGRHATLAPAS